MKNCIVCLRFTVVKILDLGKHPVSSHYIKDPKITEYKHNLSLGQCLTCGVMQLFDRFPWKKIVPRYDWTVRYAEPEEHLDGFVSTITKLSGINKNSKICGLSYKDISTISRLKNKGYSYAVMLNNHDLGIMNNFYGVETVQNYFTPMVAKKIVSRTGKQDIVIIRHILEHVYNPKIFLAAVNELLRPGGYIAVEVPDIGLAIKQKDFTTIWEEHTMYFTEASFRWICSFFGYKLIYFKEFQNPLENSLTGIAQYQPSKIVNFPPKSVITDEVQNLARFASAFEIEKKKIQKMLSKFDSIVLFGAGHLGSVWMNIFDVSKYVYCFIDNDKNKTGMFMPGSHLLIRQPYQLLKYPIGLCLLSSNPSNEKIMMGKNKNFFSHVKSYASIFPRSKMYISKVL